MTNDLFADAVRKALAGEAARRRRTRYNRKDKWTDAQPVVIKYPQREEDK